MRTHKPFKNVLSPPQCTCPQKGGCIVFKRQRDTKGRVTCELGRFADLSNFSGGGGTWALCPALRAAHRGGFALFCLSPGNRVSTPLVLFLVFCFSSRPVPPLRYTRCPQPRRKGSRRPPEGVRKRKISRFGTLKWQKSTENAVAVTPSTRLLPLLLRSQKVRQIQSETRSPQLKFCVFCKNLAAVGETRAYIPR